MTFDFEKFREFLLVDRPLARITVANTVKRLRAAEAAGFALRDFTLSDERGARDLARRYLAKRRSEGVGAGGYNNDVRAINAAARFLGLEGVKFQRLPEPRKQEVALGREAVRRLLSYEGEKEETTRRRRALAVVALVTGARASEVAALTVDDLDAEQSRIHIRKPAKGGMARWLPVERWVFSPKRPLAAWLRIRSDLEPPRGGPLWTTSRDYNPRRCSPEFVRLELPRIGAEVGVPVNFTITRHTRATQLAKAGFPVQYVAWYLGHADWRSSQRYVEVRPDDVVRELQRLRHREPLHDPFGGSVG